MFHLSEPLRCDRDEDNPEAFSRWAGITTEVIQKKRKNTDRSDLPRLFHNPDRKPFSLPNEFLGWIGANQLPQPIQ